MKPEIAVKLSEIFQKLLCTTELTYEDDLFDFGATSFTMVQMVDSVNEYYDIIVPVDILLDNPTINSIASYISEALGNKDVEQYSIRENEKNSGIASNEKYFRGKDIAIIGISGRFPGADDLDAYWNNLKEGKRNFSKLSFNNTNGYRTDVNTESDFTHTAAFLNEINCFDSLLFNIAPAEAKYMDPQERLMLESVWECLENSGYTSEFLKNQKIKVGVFIGVMWDDYQHYTTDGWKDVKKLMVSSHHSSIANRVSYYFDFTGPSISLNTSCSSSMTAIHFACNSIKSGECDVAIVGGVNLLSHPYHLGMLGSASLLSSQEESNPFRMNSDGLIVGEGVSSILLKSKEEAEKCMDTIHGVIKGSAIGHSGRSSRYGSPKSESQKNTILEVLNNAGLSPESISYIEAAAPGSSMADASEITAINEVFKDSSESKPVVYIGTVKGNIGHLESASAMSQLMKVLLQLKYRQLCPIAGFGPLNPLIHFEESRLKIVEKLRPWTCNNNEYDDQDYQVTDSENGAKRRALVNAFGATGTSAHIVIEEYLNSNAKRSETIDTTGIMRLVLLSAASQQQLLELVNRLLNFVSRPSSQLPLLSDLSYTLVKGRVSMVERVAIVVESYEQLRDKLNAILNSAEKISSVFKGSVNVTSKKDLIEKKSDLLSIAKHWAEGGNIPDDLFSGEEVGRIPLPTYPFDKVVHWINDNLNRESVIVTGAGYAANKDHKNQLELNDTNLKSLSRKKILLSKIEDYLKRIYSSVSEIPMSKLSTKLTFDEYGISSLMITKLNLKLESDFGELSKTLFFEYQNIEQLAQYFLNFHEKEAITLLGSIESYTGDYLSKNYNESELDNESMNRKIKNVDSIYGNDVAVIGLGGKYPKASNIDEFWENIRNGRNCITEIPKDRWNYKDYYNPDKAFEGKIHSKWGGFIEGVDLFDPLFFKISPKDAELMDPQARLFLEVAWHTVEDAGYNKYYSKLAFDNNVGVFVGFTYEEYQLLSLENGSSKVPEISPSYGGMIANRISYFFDFQGPSMAVDTLCSASLTALHLAVNSVLNNECRAAIVGGVNLNLHPAKYFVHTQLNVHSSDGLCRSFGKGGDGLVPGEGIGAIFIKPLEEAVADEDHIYGIIKATAINNDGKTNGFTVPNPNAQEKMIKGALKSARVEPGWISYVEAHGTGTSLGDPVEITGLSKAFKSELLDPQYCSIGSVKSNIGHLEPAAGIAGVTKVLLQMKHKLLVPSLHSADLNPNINFSKSPFYVQQRLQEWKRPVVNIQGEKQECPRIACISSFGAGGSNAHAVLEEYIPTILVGEKEDNIEYKLPKILFPISARDKDRLFEYVEILLEYIKRGSTLHSLDSKKLLNDLAYTFQVGRDAMDKRLGLVVESLQELEEKLQHFILYQSGADGIFFNSNNQENENSTLYETEEDAELLFNIWIQEGKYSTIMQCWVNGMDLDWKKLYGKCKPKRISAPGYPFERVKCWIGQDNDFGNKTPYIRSFNSLTSQNTENKFYLKKIWSVSNLDKNSINSNGRNGTVIIITSDETKNLARQISENIECNVEIINELDAELLVSKLDEIRDELIGCIDVVGCGKNKDNNNLSWIELTQKLIEICKKDGINFLCVTQGLESIDNLDVNLTGALRASLYRMLQSEYPYVLSKHLDVDPTSDNLEIVNNVVNEFYSHSEECEVCYRKGVRYKISLADEYSKIKLSNAIQFPEEKVLLITGGTRGLGYLCAMHFVKNHGVKKLVLLGKEKIPPQHKWNSYKMGNDSISKKIKSIQALKDLGADVTILSTPLSDELRIKNDLENIENNIGEIGGVIHCAGLANFSEPSFIRKSVSEIKNVLEPKVFGLDILLDSMRMKPLQFFAVFSSVSSIIPTLSVGLSDYAMANSYMDYIAQAQKYNFPLISIQWPSWKESGAGEVTTNVYRQTGLLSITDEDGLLFLDTILSNNLGPVILPAVVDSKIWDADKVMSRHAQEKKYKSINQQIIEKPVTNNSVVTTGSRTYIETIENWLLHLFSRELKVDFEKMDLSTPLENYGVDSITLAKVSRKINEKLTEPMDPSALYEHTSIESLANWLASVHKSIQLNQFGEDRKAIEDWLSELFSRQLKIDLEKLDRRTSLEDYGVDSIILAQVSRKINEKLTEPMDPSALYEHTSIESLANWLVNTYGSIQLPGKDNNFISNSLSGGKSCSLSGIKSKRTQPLSQDIAVVGMSCRFPGAENLDKYWNLLSQGISAIAPIPENRFSSSTNLYAGLIGNISRFDPEYFFIPKEDAKAMDPQALLLLEESLNLIYHAGYTPEEVKGSNMGVYLGGRSQNFPKESVLVNSRNPIMAVGQNYLATNISNYFDLRGPSLVVDTACSSALVGMWSGIKDLLSGDIDSALVGGVNLLLDDNAHRILKKRGILSTDSSFHIFDQRESGIILGEGIGLVLLKTLESAQESGDNIYAIIKGMAVNNDGRTAGPATPNIEAQKEVMRKALYKSNKMPYEIDYIEANGSGSEVTDLLELKAIESVYRSDNKEPCGLGSMKPNIGHPLCAEGIAGFIKLALMISYRERVPFLSGEKPMIHYNIEKSPFYFDRTSRSWEKKNITAALNCFADGGTNAHIILGN